MRWFWGAAAIVLVAVGAVLLFRAQSTTQAALPPLPAAQTDAPAASETPAELPEAAPATREERRFNRYDKDRDARITREEYLASRRKAFAKLDANGDGRLSFDEWVVRTADRFAQADADRDASLTRAEFATTAPKRRTRAPACVCPPVGEGSAD